MRTGGTTLSQQLLRRFPPDAVYPNPKLDFVEGDVLHQFDLAYVLGLSDSRRTGMRFWHGHFPFVVTELLGVDVACFSLLREPVERIVSLLHLLGQRVESLRDLSLEERYHHRPTYSRFIENHQTKVFSMTLADEPRTYFDELAIDDARLARAKHNLARLDVLGVTERYGEFVAALRQQFGWQLRNDIQLNGAVRTCDAPPCLLRQIADDNRYDLDLYEYATELVGQGVREQGQAVCV